MKPKAYSLSIKRIGVLNWKWAVWERGDSIVTSAEAKGSTFTRRQALKKARAAVPLEITIRDRT